MRCISLGTLLLLSAGNARSEQQHGVVLLYHHVSNETPASTSIHPEQFAAHLNYLAEHGHEVMDLAAMLEALSAGRSVPDKAVAITFDDGYESVLSQAAPMLAEREWPFTVFVSTAQVGKGTLFLDWPQLHRIQQLGGRIANHGQHHGHMAVPQRGERLAQWRSRVENEIRQAQADIEAHLGKTSPIFAYPYGEYSLELQDIVKELGFMGLAQHSGAAGHQTDFSAVPRHPFHTGADDLARLAERLSTQPLHMRASPATGYTTKEASFDIDLNPESGAYRRAQLACFLNGRAVTGVEPSGSVNLTLSDLRIGRNVLICTAPLSDGGGYAWWSHLTMRTDGAGAATSPTGMPP